MYNVYACQQEVADDVNAKQEARQSAKSSKEIFFSLCITVHLVKIVVIYLHAQDMLLLKFVGRTQPLLCAMRVGV